MSNPDMNAPYTLQLRAFADADEQVRSLFDLQTVTEGSWAWFQALAESTLSDGEVAAIAILRRNQIAQAALPVAASGNRMRSLCAPYTTCYRPPLGNAGAVLGNYLAKLIQYRFDLHAFDAEDPGMACFVRGLRQGGLRTACYGHFANWYDSVPDFGAYWQARAGQLRTTVQRKMARLERGGRLTFTELDLARNAADGLRLYQNIYAASWKEAEPNPTFIPTLFRLLGPTRELRMGAVLIDGEPAAVQLWLVKNNTATIFKLAHKMGFDEHSPGTLLTNWLLHLFVVRDSVRDIDFGRGDDPYKKLWLGRCRQRSGMVAFNTGSVRGLYSAFSELIPTRMAAWKAKRRVENVGKLKANFS